MNPLNNLDLFFALCLYICMIDDICLQYVEMNYISHVSQFFLFLNINAIFSKKKKICNICWHEAYIYLIWSEPVSHHLEVCTMAHVEMHFLPKWCYLQWCIHMNLKSIISPLSLFFQNRVIESYSVFFPVKVLKLNSIKANLSH